MKAIISGKGVARKVKAVAEAIEKMANLLRIREQQIQYMQLKDYKALKQFVYTSVMQDKPHTFRQYAREIIKKALKTVNIPVLREKFDKLHRTYFLAKNNKKRQRRKNREKEVLKQVTERAKNKLHPVMQGTKI
jgi:hypothetical protein